MSVLAKCILDKKQQGQKGLIVYLTAGFPDAGATVEAVLAAAGAGADVVEIGIPFSDPIADGPIIQQAAAASLAGGTTTAGILEMTRKIRRQTAVPLAIMTYVNTILSYGVSRFVRDFAEAGVNGLIVPDLPLEEADLLVAPCRETGLDLIRFVAPTTGPERIAAICRDAGGFLYCISATGVTGVREMDYSLLAESIGEIRKYSEVPTAIGFGIGSPEAAREAARYADAVIVGSALIRSLGEKGVCGVRELVGAIRKALDGEASEA